MPEATLHTSTPVTEHTPLTLRQIAIGSTFMVAAFPGHRFQLTAKDAAGSGFCRCVDDDLFSQDLYGGCHVLDVRPAE